MMARMACSSAIRLVIDMAPRYVGAGTVFPSMTPLSRKSPNVSSPW
jgi:hypothetical protein